MNRFVLPLSEICKAAAQIKSAIESNPFQAVIDATELPAKIISVFKPLIDQSDATAKKFRDWIFRSKKQFEQVDMGGGVVNIKMSAKNCIYPNTAEGAVNYAVEEIPGLEGSEHVTAEPWDKHDHYWIVLCPKQRKAYLVDLIQCTHKPIDLKGREAKVKEALWPFSKKMPKSFSIGQECLCTYFGMPCTGKGTVSFERTKEGWKVKGQMSPLTDDQIAALLKSCKVKN